MSRLDKLKEDIAFEKHIFYILLAAGLAIVGWIFSNAEVIKPHLLYIAGGGGMADGLALAFLGRRIKNKIRELEDL